MPDVREFIQHLRTHYKPDDVVAKSIWSVDDVLLVAEEETVKINRKDAEEILDQIDRNHDANTGITWDVLRAHLDIYSCACRRLQNRQRTR